MEMNMDAVNEIKRARSHMLVLALDGVDKALGRIKRQLKSGDRLSSNFAAEATYLIQCIAAVEGLTTTYLGSQCKRIPD